MKRFLVAAALYLAALAPASANVPCSLPFNLVNGTTADASQVMANYNALVSCLSSAAAAGVNNDITQLIGLTTPLPPSEGGTSVFIGGTSSGPANAQVVSTTTPNGFALNLNYTVIFKAGITNTGATTLRVGSTTALNLFKQTPTGPTALAGNEIQAGQIVFAFYDGTQWEMLPPLSVTAGFGLTATGGATVAVSSTLPPYGFTAPVNMGLTAAANTPSASLLQVCMTDQLGATPSAASPVLIPFQAATPNVVWRSVTSATCIDTNAAGATLGTQNSVPFRLWVVAFDNAGTVVLGLWHSGAGAATTAIAPLQEELVQSSTAISAAATSAGVFYTQNGTTVSSKNFRIIGFLTFDAGEPTAGSYTVAPGTSMFGPGLKKPGDIVQTVAVITTTSLSITPSSSVNLVKATASASTSVPSAGTAGVATFRRGTTDITPNQQVFFSGSAVQMIAGMSIAVLDAPGTTSATTYGWHAVSGSPNFTGSTILLEEIMG